MEKKTTTFFLLVIRPRKYWFWVCGGTVVWGLQYSRNEEKEGSYGRETFRVRGETRRQVWCVSLLAASSLWPWGLSTPFLKCLPCHLWWPLHRSVSAKLFVNYTAISTDKSITLAGQEKEIHKVIERASLVCFVFSTILPNFVVALFWQKIYICNIFPIVLKSTFAEVKESTEVERTLF